MPSVQIVGDREVHVKAGTSVTLKCLISNCLEEPAYVFWYHGERRLLDDDDQIPGKENQILISVWLRIFSISIWNFECCDSFLSNTYFSITSAYFSTMY